MRICFTFVGAIFTLAQLAGSVGLQAQTAAAAAPPEAKTGDGPRIRFSETSFNFGTVKPSDVLRHDFIVTNTGTAVLEISEVRPGCGCTTAGSWDREVQPGQTGKIPIQLNPTSFSGAVGKSVSVTCNDPTQPNHTLQLQANVWRPIDVQPPYAYFTPIQGEETNETKVVRIVNNLDAPLTVEAPPSPNPAFKLELKAVKPGKEFELHITYGGPVSNAPSYAALKLKTSSTNMPELNISVSAMPRPALVMMPAQIQLPAGQLTSGHRHSQTIRNIGSKPVKLSEPAVNADGVTVDLSETQPGKLFTLNLNFPPGFKAQSSQPLELSVKTTHPAQPIVKVPIIIQPQAPATVVTPKSTAAVPAVK